MWCKECRRETVKNKCELCGKKTEQETPLEVYWCNYCKIPIIKYANAPDREVCPLCNSEIGYLCRDLRPVFPEERLLFEIVQGKPFAHIGQSVWASDNRYYIDGKAVAVTQKFYKKLDPEVIRKLLDEYSTQNSYTAFDKIIELFVKANEVRLKEIISEAYTFIQKTEQGYERDWEKKEWIKKSPPYPRENFLENLITPINKASAKADVFHLPPIN